MAIKSKIQVYGADVADCYIRLTDIMGKKNREDEDPENHSHYVTYGVRVETADGTEVKGLSNLDRFKVKDIDPSSDIPALCYTDLKERIVALGWETDTADIEDV